jgi:hypothetical protein
MSKAMIFVEPQHRVQVAQALLAIAGDPNLVEVTTTEGAGEDEYESFAFIVPNEVALVFLESENAFDDDPGTAVGSEEPEGATDVDEVPEVTEAPVPRRRGRPPKNITPDPSAAEE